MQQTNPQPTHNPAREGLVARCRQEIEDGTYVTQDKLDVAVERLLRAFDNRVTPC